MQLHAAAYIFKLHFNGLYITPVLFEIYKLAPCDTMQLHASLSFILMVFIQLQYYLKYNIQGGFMWLHAASCISRLHFNGLHTAPSTI